MFLSNLQGIRPQKQRFRHGCLYSVLSKLNMISITIQYDNADCDLCKEAIIWEREKRNEIMFVSQFYLL